MGKQTKHNRKDINYRFQLRGNKTVRSIHFRKPIEADFSPQSAPRTQIKPRHQATTENPSKSTSPSLSTEPILSRLPTFNFDRLFFTPSFVVPQLYANSKTNYLTYHEGKVQDAGEKSQAYILVPKPKIKHMYCGVCYNFFDDYLQHIFTDSHRQQTKKCPAHMDILKLCQKYKALNPTPRNGLDKICSKNTLPSVTQDQDSTKQSQSKIQGATHVRSPSREELSL